ncbi:MAPKBP1 [Lepeophtheirus salmonis]|uniref:MAPKBP1 n=1 Tax=Lepeophtheirus salmonis TaxID=72036 RepID=A0A7R8HD03_LEPSM|nr:MAPKBP1 [Lepeophtheirus salmonis]CAF3016819.1 MAPKBP1 [Lepeophtheirus salmonis]
MNPSELTDTSTSSGGSSAIKKKVTIAEEENVVVEHPSHDHRDRRWMMGEGSGRERTSSPGKVKIDLKTSRIKSNEEIEAERDAKVMHPSLHKVKLERVLGLTVPSNAGLASSPATGIVAYPAGCTVTITSVGFSEDGRFLVTGECGHLPSVRIWDVHEKNMIAEFSGHKFGINCVAFAPNNKYVVSVGSQHDMIVNVWDWKNNVKVASNKISTKVKAISFSENGNYFVTAGNRHVKFWYLEYSRSKYKDPMPLMGRSAILGEQRNNYFCDVSCGRGEMGDSTYAITKSGLLCEFNNRRLLDKWVELRTQNANCLSVGEDYVFIGCGDGIIRCFSPHTLQFITTLPRTHYLGVDVSKGLSISHMASHPPTAKYPDAKAITYDEQNFKVTVVYNDHIGKSHSFIFHSACIWGLEIYPSFIDGEKKNPQQKPVLPPGSFITCSSDDTIRIWNLSSNMSHSTLYRRNIYSDELLKTLYVDSELNHIKELDNSNVDKGVGGGSVSGGGGSNGGETVVDQRNGVRCIRISLDGKHLASGDRSGNIRVHDLQFMDEICKIEAHDAEVLCLEYCGPIENSKGKYLLASASRDRLIHIFNATRDYNFLTTLDDHSSSITAVKFLPSPYIQMVSCGADKSIIFRDINVDKQKGLPEFSRGTHVVGKTTLYDMEVDHNAKHILTACQDRNIRIYTVGNGKHLRTFKGSVSDDGTLIKVVLDHSGLYAATSCTDKTLAIYDYYSGECMATMFGHSELVTGLKFTEDCKHLISVSGDGCIFVWRLPHEMTSNMIAKLATVSRKDSSSRIYIGNNNEEYFGSPPPDMMHPTVNRDEEDDSYRFRTKNSVDYPKGRWAQRVGSRGMTVKSHYDSDSVIPFPKKFDSNYNNSKDSSLETGEYKQQKDLEDDYSLSEIENNRGTSPQQQKDSQDSQRSKLRLDALPSHLRPEHDADIDEYSDGLTTQDDGGESTEPEVTERTMYFGQSEETPGVYTVNAMDVDELRRSQRRSKKPGKGIERLQQGSSSNSNTAEVLTTPSQDSDSDDSEEEDEEDEEVSTPSADKNILSILSVSSENVDLVGRRERFLKSNFESLGSNSGLVTESNSFSNQYREGSALHRNASTIARAQSFRDKEQNRKREELQRRIEETKKKLQNIGYRSMIKGSQSISDLSMHIPEKDFSEGSASRPTSRNSARGFFYSPSSYLNFRTSGTLSETDASVFRRRNNFSQYHHHALLLATPRDHHHLVSSSTPKVTHSHTKLRRTLSARSSRVRNLKKSSVRSSYSSDSDSSSHTVGGGFGDYLSSLSACPPLVGNLPTSSSTLDKCYGHSSLCRHISMPFSDLPSIGKDTGDAAFLSESETVISDSFSDGDSLSLHIKEEKISPRKERIITERLREMAAKFERDEMVSMEKELEFLEKELCRRRKKRNIWNSLTRRLSKEIFGKFNENIRVWENKMCRRSKRRPSSFFNLKNISVASSITIHSSPNTPSLSEFPPSISKKNLRSHRRCRSLTHNYRVYAPPFLTSSPPIGAKSMWIPMTSATLGRNRAVVVSSAPSNLTRRISLQNLSCINKCEIVDDCRTIGNFSHSEREDLDSGLRRTCSLSDLNKPIAPRRILPAPPATVSGKKVQSSSKHWKFYPSSQTQHQYQQYQQMQPQTTKTLHGPPIIHDRPIANRSNNYKNLGGNAAYKSGPEFIYGEDGSVVPSYMRSTSASVKKEKQYPLHQSNTIPRRKSSIGQMSSQSTSDLRSTKEGGGGSSSNRIEDSSSEENSDRKSGRRRSSSQDRRSSSYRNNGSEGVGLNHEHRARSERDLSKVTKVKVRTNSKEDSSSLGVGGPTPSSYYKQQKNKMKTTTLIVNNNDEDNGLNINHNNNNELRLIPSTRTAAALVHAADNLVQLYKRIAIDYDLNDNMKSELLAKLANSAVTAQQTLNPVHPGMAHGELASAAMSSIKQILSSKQGPHDDNSGSSNSYSRGGSGANCSSTDLASNPYFMHMIENYSSMMLQNLAHQRQIRDGDGDSECMSDSANITVNPIVPQSRTKFHILLNTFSPKFRLIGTTTLKELSQTARSLESTQASTIAGRFPKTKLSIVESLIIRTSLNPTTPILSTHEEEPIFQLDGSRNRKLHDYQGSTDEGAISNAL